MTRRVTAAVGRHIKGILPGRRDPCVRRDSHRHVPCPTIQNLEQNHLHHDHLPDLHHDEVNPCEARDPLGLRALPIFQQGWECWTDIPVEIE